MQGRKMFTTAKHVHIVEKVPKEACKPGRCSQVQNMFTLWERFPNKHAGQEDVHKCKICSHRGKGSQRSMQARKMFTTAKYVHIMEKVPKGSHCGKGLMEIYIF